MSADRSDRAPVLAVVDGLRARAVAAEAERDRLAEALRETNHPGIPVYAMLDVWMALGGDPAAFERMWDEDRRTPADTWAQLMAVVRGESLAADTNPPAGPEFDRLCAALEGKP